MKYVGIALSISGIILLFCSLLIVVKLNDLSALEQDIQNVKHMLNSAIITNRKLIELKKGYLDE